MNATMNTTELTADSLALFLAYAKDADNWSGNPLVGGNVRQGMKENGHLTDLKKKGLLTTESEVEGGRRLEWVYFTDAGIALAAAHGVEVSK